MKPKKRTKAVAAPLYDGAIGLRAAQDSKPTQRRRRPVLFEDSAKWLKEHTCVVKGVPYVDAREAMRRLNLSRAGLFIWIDKAPPKLKAYRFSNGKMNNKRWFKEGDIVALEPKGVLVPAPLKTVRVRFNPRLTGTLRYE